jgi:hypothetical protein
MSNKETNEPNKRTRGSERGVIASLSDQLLTITTRLQELEKKNLR